MARAGARTHAVPVITPLVFPVKASVRFENQCTPSVETSRPVAPCEVHSADGSVGTTLM